MASTSVINQHRPTIVSMSIKEAASIAIIGLIVGILSLVIFLLLDRYILSTALCGPVGLEQRCADKTSFASGIAIVIGAVLGLFATVQQRAYRPLLVIILATISFWGIFSLLSTLNWLAMIAAAAILFALCYLAFSWIVQLRNIYIALALGILLTIIIRLVIS